MSDPTTPPDFIRQIVADDVAAGKHGGHVRTRFPPEPNGLLHIGHAKAICLDFEVAREFGGACNLRMDDTNPTTEDPRYVEAICRDIEWLGFEWEGSVRYASDYFEALYRLATALVEDGLAYVDSLSEKEIRDYRGSVTEGGRPSPYRDRSADENLDLFRRMREGEFEDGAHVLRGKIDLAHPNMLMRDPILFRIRHARHYRTGETWPIYPMYDWAHSLSDAIEGITHSFCSLEFDVHRPVYDWTVDVTRPAAAGLESLPEARGGGGEEPGSWDPRPRQYEFSRLNLDYTVMSKRKLLALVREGLVEGWDDPRMPTLAGLRRRGVTPEAIRTFVDMVGLSKADQRADIGKLEYAIRDDLNRRVPRIMCVTDPLEVVVENFPEGEVEWLQAPHFPRGVDHPPKDWPESRSVPFSRTLYIEREDFDPDPPEGYRRLAPGREVRLRHGYFLACREAVRDPESGEPVELRCTYDPDTRGGSAPDGRKPSGTIHWVSAGHALRAELRLYDRLFEAPDPERGVEDFRAGLNPESLVVRSGAAIEPSAAEAPPGTRYQFERIGYFVRDPGSDPERLVFNLTVPLRDAWTRRQERQEAEAAAGPEPTKTGSGGPPSGARRATRGEGAREDGGPVERRLSEEGKRARADSAALAARFDRYRESLGLSEEDADILTTSEELSVLFEATLDEHDDPQPVANWIIHELRGLLGDREIGDLPFGGRELGRLVGLVEDDRISGTVARELLARMIERGGDPVGIVEREGLERIADRDAIETVVARLIERHPDEATRYREGQEALAGFFVGQVMRETDGRADPRLAREVVRSRLGGSG